MKHIHFWNYAELIIPSVEDNVTNIIIFGANNLARKARINIKVIFHDIIILLRITLLFHFHILYGRTYSYIRPIMGQSRPYEGLLLFIRTRNYISPVVYGVICNLSEWWSLYTSFIAVDFVLRLSRNITCELAFNGCYC